MRKKIIIALFFATIMLLLPAASSFKTDTDSENEDFEIPLSEEDQKELLDLISKETYKIENELTKILTDEGKLKFEELEIIYEEYIETGDSSVIDSDSWDWVLDRLGWIYITFEYVLTIYYDAMAIYSEITQGSQVFQTWYNSIINFRQAWQNFKQNPLNFNNITNLLMSAIDLLTATIDVVNYVSSQDLIDSLNAFMADVQEFITFIQNEPWNAPILIYGNVNGVDESVTISVTSDSMSTTNSYNLSYTTSDSALSWFVHKCAISAEYKGKSFTKNRYAFSMGKIKYNIDEADFNSKAKSKIYFERLDFFSKLNLIFFSFFEKLNLDF